MKPILAALFLAALLVPGVSADVLYPNALTFEPGFAAGPPQGFPYWLWPDYGDPLTIVGRVAAVSAPFDDLLPAGPYELTYVYEGAACTQFGNWDNIPCSGGLFGTFEGGTVSFYLDTTPDAEFLAPDTFRDGELVLLAQSSYVYVADDDPSGCPMLPNPPDVVAYFAFIGGSWFDRVSHNGAGFDAGSRGELDYDVSPVLQALGYIFRVDGTVDIDGPVPVEMTTWGRVKALYR